MLLALQQCLVEEVELLILGLVLELQLGYTVAMVQSPGQDEIVQNLAWLENHAVC